MPQSTNLNTPPYFEDFDSNKNFHKVLFRPGYPLQARELTTIQSILQNQIENFGSSIYKEGAMVIPGQIGYDLYYNAVLIEDEYFGISADDLSDYVVGQTIVGNTSGVRARIVNILTSGQSEKGFTTLYVKYLSAGSTNNSGSFLDDEILITEKPFSVGNTVIQENTDFAKCISLDSTFVGSSAKITSGVYYTKGYFVNVKEQEIILDQFSTIPSYKIGLQVLEEIVTPEDDISLTDPSQGYSNYSAPGAHRFKLTAVLTKKSLDDTSVTNFIELLRLDNGQVREIVGSSKAQLAKTLEDTFARRTFDESGDYEVRPYDFSKDECLNNGVNNGLFSIIDTTDYGNIPSKDLFEINVSPGKSYVSGYELETLATTYVDIEKPRTTESIGNATIRTDARGIEFRIANSSNNNQLTQSQLNTSLNNIVALLDASDVTVGYALMRSYEEIDSDSDYIVIRLANIKFINTTFTILGNLKKIRFAGTIDYVNNTSSGGVIKNVSLIAGNFVPYFFSIYGNNVIKLLNDAKIQNILTKYIGSTASTNTILISGRNYYSLDASDYTLRINGDAGTVQRTISSVSIDSSNTLQFTYSGSTVASGTSFTLIGPEKINVPTVKLSSHKKMRVVKLSTIAGKYDVNDTSISLGTTRVSKIHAIYNINSNSYNTQDILPKITLESGVGVFKIGEVIVGKSSGAKARIIKQDLTDIYFTYISQSNFLTNEEIFGYTTASTGTITQVDFNGIPDIKTRYRLDDGQRDQTFEFSTLTKISSDSVVTGDLIVVMDHFEDQVSSGEFYTVNSYYDADFDEIPYYSYDGNKLYLSDLIDWRINQSDVYTVSSTGEYNNPHTIDPTQIISGTNLLSYGNTNYNISSDYLIPTGTTDGDIEYYVGRIDEVYLDKNGKFISKKGSPAVNPKKPSDSLANAMKVLTVIMPAYVRDIDEIIIRRHTNKRYTMRDIGNLEQRINNIEYYTQLSLLETETANLFIDDGTGGNRLKNGFLVDNFTSHSIGQSDNPNYRCSMDMALGEMRPQHYTTNVKLRYEETPENYIKGDFIMLDYEDKLIIEQEYAAVVENVNPFAVVSWVGLCFVYPASDDWIDEERLPESLTEVEGDYTATAFALGVDRNTGFAPVEWGAWQTQWSTTSSSSSTGIERQGGGIPIRNVTTTSSSTTTFQTRSGIRTRVTPRTDRKVLGDRIVDTKYAFWKRSRNISITSFRLKPNIRVYPFFDGRDVSAYTTPKILQIQMATNSVAFQIGEDIIVTGNVNRKFRATVASPSAGIESLNRPYLINPYTGEEITASQYTSTSTILNLDISSMQKLNSSEMGGYVLEGDTIVGVNSGATASVIGKKLIADEKGNLRASFYIPDSTDDANPRWKVGQSVFRLSDSPINSQVPGVVDSSAEGVYTASGTILTKQQDTLLLRNAEIARDTVFDSRTLTSSSSSTRVGGWFDPLAQSFLIEEAGGCYITKIDVYFYTKDESLPVTMQIREMVNGYPSPEILGTVNNDPINVFVSDDASVPTTFVFETPVYLAERKEYCFAVLTSSLEYRVWLSEMGKDDLSGEKISKQPYAGVLFKSQNASTWTTAELQDFKFKIYRASFKINETPTIKLINDNTGTSQFTRLRRDPIELNINGGRIKVNHHNHGMYDSASYVEIKGVSSEQYCQLSADWSGLPGSTLTVSGNRESFAYTANINGVAPSDNNPGYIKIGDAIYSYNPNGGVGTESNGQYTILTIEKISGTLPSDGFKVSDEWLIENYVIDGVPLTFINTFHTNLEWITLDSYQINLSNITRTSGSNSTVGGENVFASQNIQYTQFLPLITYKELPGTSVVATYSGTTGTSIGSSTYSDPTSFSTPEQKSYIKDSSFTSIVLNENNELNIPYTIASKINEDRQMIGANSTSMHITLSSSVENLSPIIDKDRISIITTNNRVTDFTGQSFKKEYFFNVDGLSTNSPDETIYDIAESSLNDNNAANYITKLASLQNECSALKIEFAAFNPSICDIDVYVKLLTGEEGNPNDVSWVQVTATNYNNRSEVTFTDLSYNYEMPSGETFSKYSVKIRMRSRNSAVVPIIKDLRCIALA
jgi:hypothetical protein